MLLMSAGHRNKQWNYKTVHGYHRHHTIPRLFTSYKYKIFKTKSVQKVRWYICFFTAITPTNLRLIKCQLSLTFLIMKYFLEITVTPYVPARKCHFPDFSSKFQFSITQINIPWLFPDLNNFSSAWPFPHLQQPCCAYM